MKKLKLIGICILLASCQISTPTIPPHSETTGSIARPITTQHTTTSRGSTTLTVKFSETATSNTDFKTQFLPLTTEEIVISLKHPNGTPVKNSAAQAIGDIKITVTEEMRAQGQFSTTLDDLPVETPIIIKVEAKIQGEAVAQIETEIEVAKSILNSGNAKLALKLEPTAGNVEVQDIRIGKIVPKKDFCTTGYVQFAPTLKDPSGEVITAGISKEHFKIGKIFQPANTTASIVRVDIIQEGQVIGDGTITDAVLLIDSSTSMRGDKLTEAKKAAKSLVQNHNGRVALYSFAGQLSDFTSDKVALNQKIDEIFVAGLTPLYSTLEQIMTEIGNGGLIVALTDGEANRGESLTSAVSKAKNSSTTIYTVGLGSDVNTQELTQLATQTGGSYSTADVSTLLDVFKGITRIISGSALVTVQFTPPLPNTIYQFELEATNQSKPVKELEEFTSPSQVQCNSTTVVSNPATVPQNLRAQNISDTSVTILWDALPQANSYQIYANGQQIQSNITASSVTLNGLNPGQTYTIEVSAMVNGQETAKAQIPLTMATVTSYKYRFSNGTQSATSLDGSSNPTEWGAVLKLAGKIEGSQLSVTVTKQDGTTFFKNNGKAYLKVGTFEPHGVNHQQISITQGVPSLLLTDDLSQYDTLWSPNKPFYVRVENDEGQTWAGPLFVERYQ